jgi:hypothetical protein
VADEADGSVSLDSFDVDVERCGSVSTRGVTELYELKKKWSGITFGLRGKRPLTLNPELPIETEAAFPQDFL